MRTKLIVLVAAVLCIALVFVSCASTTPAASSAAASSAAASSAAPAASSAPAASESTSAAPASAAAADSGKDVSGKNIGYILAGPDIYYQQSYAVFEALAKEAGWNVSKTSSNYDPKTETNNVQDMIAKKVDAIVLCDVTSSNGAACAKLANDANIPIFFITTLPDPKGVGKPTASCSGPWYQSGYEDGKWLLSKAKDPKNPKLILVEGAYGQGTSELQRLGLLTALSDALGKPVDQVFKDNIIYNQTAQWATDQATTVMQDALSKTGGNFDGIFAGNEAEMNGILKALQPTGKTYPIATENGYEETIEMIKTNANIMTVSIPATAEGELVFQQMKAYFQGAEFPKFVKDPFVVVDSDTVNSVSALPYKNTDNYLAASKAGKTVNALTMQDSGSSDPDWSGMVALNGIKSK